MNGSERQDQGVAGAPARAPEEKHEAGLQPRLITRRKAIPLMGLAVLAVGTACDLENDPVAASGGEGQDWLAKARVHRGGIQRFALQHTADGVAVRVENAPGAKPGTLTVTVYETDPMTGGFVMGADGPRILEVHEGVTNATISQIDSSYFVFYYVDKE